MIGPIEIRIPADPTLSRPVRLAASALASMGGFDVELLDDVKLAISEIVLALIERGSGAGLTLSMTLDGVSFCVEGSTPVDTFDVSHADLDLCRSVLTGITVSHEIAYSNGRASIRAELRDLET